MTEATSNPEPSTGPPSQRARFLKDAVNLAGSVASITGISLLALRASVPTMNVWKLGAVLAFCLVGLGISAILSAALLWLNKWIKATFGSLVAWGALLLCFGLFVGLVLWWFAMMQVVYRDAG